MEGAGAAWVRAVMISLGETALYSRNIQIGWNPGARRVRRGALYAAFPPSLCIQYR